MAETPEEHKPRILVVEDEPSIREVCLRVLSREGFDVQMASDGRAGLETLREGDFDLLLIDIRTPKMSGKELYAWILENHPEMAKNVIFTTGDMMSEELLSYIKKTGRPFLPKPFTPDELTSIMKKKWGEIDAG